MATVDNIRNSLISKLLTIKDQEVLSAIDKLISSSSLEKKVELTEEQVIMLKMSDQDIDDNRTITQDQLFERERQWLNAR